MVIHTTQDAGRKAVRHFIALPAQSIIMFSTVHSQFFMYVLKYSIDLVDSDVWGDQPSRALRRHDNYNNCE